MAFSVETMSTEARAELQRLSSMFNLILPSGAADDLFNWIHPVPGCKSAESACGASGGVLEVSKTGQTIAPE
jgi:hypothetical protein